jgi:SAM-dependent methyltransferase
MMMFMRQYGLKRVLDVGCGTGRLTKVLLSEGFDVVGIDPSESLLQEAEKKGIPSERLIHGDGRTLPFSDASFDVVCQSGVLHHVAKPKHVVSEMLRVAKSAIFLSDINRFGRSHMPSRLLKLTLWKLGVWPLAYYIAKGGKSYDESDCDGIAYSYSVYDSFKQIYAWADTCFFIPTKIEGRRRYSWAHPLLTSSHVLLCGFKGGICR